MNLHFPAPLMGLLLLVAGLAACNSNTVPNTYASMSQGVGFGDYQRHLRAQEAARRSATPYSVPPETRDPAPVTTVLPPANPPAAPVVTIPAVGAGSPAVPAGEPAVRPQGLADSTNFQPVPFGSRPDGAEVPPIGTTEIVHVASVPQGNAASGPNVMAYALQTRHAVGTQLHRRNNPLRWARWERNCLQYPSQDLAQEAFLAAGGPERDSNHLDPDGDGYACWWDPAVYRRAAAQAPTVAGEALE